MTKKNKKIPAENDIITLSDELVNSLFGGTGEESNIQDILALKGIYFIQGTIRENFLCNIVCNFIAKNLDPNWNSDITLYINSPGGLASETWGLMDIMNIVKFSTKTIGFGQVASAGAMLLAAGSKGKRAVLPNTEIMIHQFSAAMDGSFNELNNFMQGANMEQQRHVNFWMQHSSCKTEKEVEEKILKKGEDNYLSAKEALRLGIIDHILKRENSK